MRVHWRKSRKTLNMPRKKTKHSYIPNESVRRSTFNRRVDNLLKKGNELSTLCGVQTFFIIHNPSDGNSTTLWPSPDDARSGLQKFLSLPEQERLKKMVLQEKYLSDRVEGTAGYFKKLQGKNEEKQMKYLMNQFVDDESINKLEMMQLASMKFFAEEKLKKFQILSGELDDAQGRLPPTYVSPNPHPLLQIIGPEATTDGNNSGVVMRNPVAALMEDLGEDKWFIETLSGVQSNIDSSRGTDIQPEATAAAASNRNEENKGGFPDDLDQAWSFIFPPTGPTY